MQIRFVDAFTDRAFAGNPAAVLLLEDGGFPSEAWLQQLAAEINLSETAYAHPLPPGADADWALRWFTPATEVNMCGHATLATAHVLRSTGVLAEGRTVRFRTHSGVLSATPKADGSITMDFPLAPLTELAVDPGYALALGAEVLRCYDTGPSVGDLLAELPDEKTVRALAPDLAAISRFEHRGVIVTAPAEQSGSRYDFVSRFFGPAVGIDEDPVTGSAHTALAALWSARTGRNELTGLQVSSRSGLVHTAVRGERVDLSGHAVTVIEGELLARP